MAKRVKRTVHGLVEEMIRRALSIFGEMLNWGMALASTEVKPWEMLAAMVSIRESRGRSRARSQLVAAGGLVVYEESQEKEKRAKDKGMRR